MSKNKNIPEVIWISNEILSDLDKNSSEICTIKTVYYNTPYILKSKYDELELKVKELEEKLSKQTENEYGIDGICRFYIPDNSTSANCIHCGRPKAFHSY